MVPAITAREELIAAAPGTAKTDRHVPVGQPGRVGHPTAVAMIVPVVIVPVVIVPGRVGSGRVGRAIPRRAHRIGVARHGGTDRTVPDRAVARTGTPFAAMIGVIDRLSATVVSVVGVRPTARSDPLPSVDPVSRETPARPVPPAAGRRTVVVGSTLAPAVIVALPTIVVRVSSPTPSDARRRIGHPGPGAVTRPAGAPAGRPPAVDSPLVVRGPAVTGRGTIARAAPAWARSVGGTIVDPATRTGDRAGTTCAAPVPPERGDAAMTVDPVVPTTVAVPRARRVARAAARRSGAAATTIPTGAAPHGTTCAPAVEVPVATLRGTAIGPAATSTVVAPRTPEALDAATTAATPIGPASTVAAPTAPAATAAAPTAPATATERPATGAGTTVARTTAVV